MLHHVFDFLASDGAARVAGYELILQIDSVALGGEEKHMNMMLLMVPVALLFVGGGGACPL